MESDLQWWREFTLDEEEAGHWVIGPFELWARRSKRDWVFAHRSKDEEISSRITSRVPAPQANFPSGDSDWTHSRFGFSRSQGSACLRPLLPNRSLIVKPEVPLVLPPGEGFTFYVGLPLWLSFRVGKPAMELWQEPLIRPSDSWFGSLTGDGELCFASRTRARLDRKDIQPHPHRAIIELRVSNMASGSLPLDAIMLPLANLSLFLCGDGMLWTETVTLQREEDGEMAALKLGDGPPEDLKNPMLLTPPRITPPKGLLVRAFDGLLNLRGGIDGLRLSRSRGAGMVDP